MIETSVMKELKYFCEYAPAYHELECRVNLYKCQVNVERTGSTDKCEVNLQKQLPEGVL